MAELPEQVAAQVARVYAEAEDELLALLARRAAAGADTGYDAWAAAKAREAALLQQAAEARVRDLQQVLVQLIDTEVSRAFAAGQLAAGGPAVAIVGRPDAVVHIIERLTSNLVLNSGLRILRDFDDAYRRVQAEAAARMATGTSTLPQAVQHSLDRYADRGISGFVDQAGRSWGLQEYAEMQVRTGTGQAMVEGRLDSYRRQGMGLVIVSDSPEECPLCRPWEGQVLGIDGPGYLETERRVVPSVSEAIAAGLFHPNCTHALGAYIEGLTQPLRNVDNPVGYELRQEQRYHERAVRHWKRRDVVAVTPQAQAQARKHLAAARSRYNAFIDSNDRIPVTWRTRVLSGRAGGG